MSSGGINLQQPLVGAPPTGSTGSAPTTNGQLAPVTAPAVAGSPASTTNTAFVPVAGQQSGSAVNGGGIVDDGTLARTAAIAASIGSSAQSQNADAAAAAQAAQGQQVVDPASLQNGQSAAPKGPAAWTDAWAAKFRDAGAPQQVMQQLMFTGAMGADEAQLQGMYDELKAGIDAELAKFNHDHPEAFKKLRGKVDLAKALGMPGESDLSALAQIAAAVNSGQMSKKQVDGLAEQAGMSMSSEMKKMALSFGLYGLIPGWGFLRLSGFLFNDGKEPFTDYPMWDTGLNKAFTIMGAAGGAFTIYNNVRGAMSVAAGHSAIKTGGDAATWAVNEGVDNLTAFEKFKSYVPGTKLNQQIGLAGSLDELQAGIKAMPEDSLARAVAQHNYDKLIAGSVQGLRESASKFMMAPIPGYQPNSRGFVMGNIIGKKGAISASTQGSRPTIFFDSRTRGPVSAAHLASIVNTVDDSAGLRSRLIAEGINLADPIVAKTGVSKQLLGQAGQHLLKAEELVKGSGIARPTGLGAVLATMRPGAIMDAVKAADNLNVPDVLAKGYGWQAIPKYGRWGLMGSIAAAGGYMMLVKPQLDARKEAAAEAAKQQAAPQGGQPGGATAEQQQLIAQFAALPKEQQAQIIQQQYAQLQQLSGQYASMTPEQQQQFTAAQAELELLMQVANGQATGGGQAPATQPAPAAQPVATAPAPAAAGAGAPQFTAQGLGLA